MQKLLLTSVMSILVASVSDKLCATLYDRDDFTGDNLKLRVATDTRDYYMLDRMTLEDGEEYPWRTPGVLWMKTDYHPHTHPLGWDWNDRVTSIDVEPDCLLGWREHPNFHNGAWGFIGCENPTDSCGGNSCNGQGCYFNDRRGWGNWMSYFSCSCKVQCGRSSSEAYGATRERWEWPQSEVVYKPNNAHSGSVTKRHRIRTCYGEWQDWGDMSGWTTQPPRQREPICECPFGEAPENYPNCPENRAKLCLKCDAGRTLQTAADGSQSCIHTPWSEWSACSKSCMNPVRYSEFEWENSPGKRDNDPGTQSRTRGCGGTPCDGDIVEDRACNPEPPACIHECVEDWCNLRGSVSDDNDLDGCDCDCADGWSNEIGVERGSQRMQCTVAHLCLQSCYEIDNKQDCEVTGMYTDLGMDCPHCYWHGEIMGCLHKREYVIGWTIDMNYDPSDIPIEAVQAHSYRYVYKYSNLSPEEITITDAGHDRHMTETVSLVDEKTELTNERTTMKLEDFRKNVEQNMISETETTAEREEWHEEKVNRKLESHSLQVKQCMSATVTKGIASASAETCATNNNHWEEENTNTQYEGGELEFGSSSTGEQKSVWEKNENEIREDWSGGERSAIEMTESSLTTVTEDRCTVDSFTVPALSTYEVFITYSKASYEIDGQATATIFTTRKDTSTMPHEITVDFGTVMHMETFSECDVQTRPAGFITEEYDCDEVQNAVTVANLLDTNTFLPRCMTPSNLYEPTQWSHKSKWCSTPRGAKNADSNELFDVIGYTSRNDFPIYDDPDNYPMDCSNQLKPSQMCNATELDLGTTPYSSTIQVPLRGYASSDLLASYPECKFSFTGLQELVKVVIPPQTQIWLKVHSDEVDATLIARFGDLCPGMSEPTEAFGDVYMANGNKLCNPSLSLSNGDLNDEVTAYVVIASNALRDMAGSTIVDIEFKTAPYRRQESVDCHRTPNWWKLNTPRVDLADWGCEYYEIGDNSLECSFDGVNTINSWVTAADVCPSCGCEDWRSTCPDVTEHWACNCHGDVENCEGVCGGPAPLCVEVEKLCDDAFELDLTKKEKSIEVPIHSYTSTDLLDSHTDCQLSFQGVQELVKVVIPAQTQLWMQVNADDHVDATLLGRFSDLCPSGSDPSDGIQELHVAHEVDRCNPSISLSNGDIVEDVVAYVVIATNAPSSTSVQIEYKTAPYYNTTKTTNNCRRNLNWWISNTPRDDEFGCEYYEQGDRSLECSFDGVNTVNGWITAADVCPSCGCEYWRADCPDVTEDWACNCNWDVEDCDGVCAGRGSICVEQCDFDYGMPGVVNLEKQAEISGRRRNIYKGGSADIDEYPWFVQIGHLGSAHYIDAIPIFQSFSTMTGGGDDHSQGFLEDAFIPHCGATMIGRSALLTAAHCVKAFKWAPPGEDEEKSDHRRVTHVSLRHGTTIVPIKRILRHKDFKDLNVVRPLNDIAIIEIEPIPCLATYQAIEIVDDFDFDNCTAFATGAGSDALHTNFAPSVSPVEQTIDDSEADLCSCLDDISPSTVSNSKAKVEEWGVYGYDDEDEQGMLYEDEQGMLYDDYDTLTATDSTMPHDELDCSDFTEEIKEWCLAENPQNRARRIYHNGKLTHGMYPDIGHFKEMITKAWKFRSCNEHHDKMYPMKDALLLEENFCAWAGDYEEHIQHPESACSGDSGSGLKIDMNDDPTSHYYGLLGLLSYGKAGGCAANGVSVFVHLAKFKSWILRAFPGAKFVTPTTCDRRDYYEGLSSEHNEALVKPATHNARLEALGYQNTFDMWSQKYLEQRCPFPLNTQLTLLVKGMPSGEVPFVVRTAMNFGNGQNSMNSRELAMAERQWLEPFYARRRSYGCLPYQQSALGKIVFVKRGRCSFSQKFKHAMEAGAFAMVVIDLSPGAVLVGMQNPSNSGFENIRENGPAMFMSRSDGLRILQAMRSRQLEFKMECADVTDRSAWHDDEEETADTANMLHSVQFCEDSPPKDCNRDILCAPLCQQETDCATRVGSCCEYDCTSWMDVLESEIGG